MQIQFPLRLVQRGPGYYLIDAADRTIAAMTADKADAELILDACNRHGDRQQTQTDMSNSHG
jgi:hypothetical protein